MLAAISPMIVWATYFVLVYAVQGIGCDRGWDRIGWLGSNALTVTLLALTVAALAAIGMLGARAWSRRVGFEGRVMGVLAVVAAIATVYVALPTMMLEPCAR